MFETLATEVEIESIRTLVAQHTALMACAFWTFGDGGQYDPEELETVLVNNPISTGDADVKPDALNQNQHRAVPLPDGGTAGAPLRDAARPSLIGWDSDRKEG